MTRTVRDDDGRPLAVVVDGSDFPEDGEVNFFTDDDHPLQLGLLSYGQGDKAAAHTHPDVPREINRHQEAIHVVEGSLSVDVYDDAQTVQRTLTVSAGETVIFLRGGRGWTAEADARVIEVKQGPFLGEDDVVKF